MITKNSILVGHFVIYNVGFVGSTVAGTTVIFWCLDRPADWWLHLNHLMQTAKVGQCHSMFLVLRAYQGQDWVTERLFVYLYSVCSIGHWGAKVSITTLLPGCIAIVLYAVAPACSSRLSWWKDTIYQTPDSRSPINWACLPLLSSFLHQILQL